MKESFYRTAMLLGVDAEERLQNAHAAVFGVGGVGGSACDALARCGLGRLTIVDSARVKPSNLNRQVCAKKSTLGMAKVEAMRLHLSDVSDCSVTVCDAFITRGNAAELIPADADVIIDAVDNVTAKLALIEAGSRMGIPVLSSMGAGNRLDATLVRVGDIYKTSVDPLARVMRRELKKRGIERLRVVYSAEQPIVPLMKAPDPDMKDNAPASAIFVPAAFGLTLAAEAIRLILNGYNSEEK